MDFVSISVECVGWTGALLVLIAYYLISTNKTSSSQSSYHWLNILGAIGLIIHTSYNAAYPSAFVNIIWVGVAIYSLKNSK